MRNILHSQIYSNTEGCSTEHILGALHIQECSVRGVSKVINCDEFFNQIFYWTLLLCLYLSNTPEWPRGIIKSLLSLYLQITLFFFFFRLKGIFFLGRSLQFSNSVRILLLEIYPPSKNDRGIVIIDEVKLFTVRD